MKCLIVIMGSNVEPSIRNIQAIKDTYIQLYNNHKNVFTHEYDFLIYRGNKKLRQLNQYELDLISPDDIENTFEKTIEAFQYINDNIQYDWIVRTNISTYVNLLVLDKMLSNLDNETVYCNKICTYLNSEKYHNLVFPRGDAYIIHKNIINNILEIYKTYKPKDDNISGIEYVDDTMLGLLLLKYFNNKTHNHIQLLNYNFIPHEYDKIDKNEINNSAFLPFTRLKTCPPNTYSGYSWGDNLYRLHDVIKFKIVNKFIEFNINEIINDNFDNFIYKYDDECIITINNEMNVVSFLELKKLLDKNNEED